MVGIYMDDSKFSYSTYILNGVKTIETRNRHTLDKFIGERVALLPKIKGDRYVVGYVNIVGVKMYENEFDFVQDTGKHYVFKDSKYYIKNKKYGYELSDPMWVDEPIKLKPIHGGNYIYREV